VVPTSEENFVKQITKEISGDPFEFFLLGLQHLARSNKEAYGSAGSIKCRK